MEMKMEISESVFKPTVNGDSPAKVEVKNLGVYYNKFRALADINLSVHEKGLPPSSGPRAAASPLCCGPSTV